MYQQTMRPRHARLTLRGLTQDILDAIEVLHASPFRNPFTITPVSLYRHELVMQDTAPAILRHYLQRHGVVC